MWEEAGHEKRGGFSLLADVVDGNVIPPLCFDI